MDLCTGCDINTFEIASICTDRESALNFLSVHKVLNINYTCPKCLSVLKLSSRNQFRCDKVKRDSKGKAERCRVQVSAFKGTWFERSCLSIEKILHLCWWFTVGRLTQEEVSSFVGVSAHTVNDWYRLCHEVVLHHVKGTSTQVGGVGKVVEICEARFGKRKNGEERLLEGVWVLGGLERQSERTFMVPVPDRTKETLVVQIREWILPGTKIISDSNLEVEGYSHEKSNHPLNYGRKDRVSDKNLAFYFFRKKYPDPAQRFHVFMCAVAALYPPPVSPAEDDDIDTST
ncbi:uncharacterized protein [Macrobrachium rosenbergii]|uniref:uncharacterized protein n=1 Tax=Macrobrachium rosenbergii TaxID=79674 RepID=UPI0034D4F5E5